MKLTLSRQSLSHALATVSHAVAPRATLPILGGVLLEASEGRLLCQATSLSLAISCHVQADVREPGRAVVPARLLSELVHSLAGETVELSRKGNAHSLEIRCGGHQSKLQGFDPEEWPAVPMPSESPALRLPAATLHEALGQTVFAVAKDDVRPAIAGLCLDCRGNSLTLAGADGFRLAIRRVSLAEEAAAPFRIIVPRRSCVELARVLADREGEAELFVSTSKLVVRAGDVTLATSLIEATFPNYQQIVPTNYTTRVSLETGRLLGTVRSMLLFRGHDSVALQFEVAPGAEGGLGSLAVSAKNADVGEGQETIACSVEGEPVQIRFNGDYLVETLQAIPTEAVFLEIQSPSRPAVVRPAGADDALHLVMPMHAEARGAPRAEEKKEEAVA